MRCSGRSSTLFRLTVARRRRLFAYGPSGWRGQTHRLPVHEVRGDCGGRGGPLLVIQVPRHKPRRWGERWNSYSFCKRHVHARTARRAEFHGERRLKHLFEQLALENARGRANAETFAFLKKRDLVGVLACEI